MPLSLLILFLFIRMCLSVQVQMTEEGVRSSRAKVIVVSELLIWTLGTELSPLQQQQMFLSTESSLHLTVYIFEETKVYDRERIGAVGFLRLRCFPLHWFCSSEDSLFDCLRQLSVVSFMYTSKLCYKIMFVLTLSTLRTGKDNVVKLDYIFMTHAICVFSLPSVVIKNWKQCI